MIMKWKGILHSLICLRHAPKTSSYFISSSPLLCAITSLLQKRDMYVERESHVNIITQIIFFSPCHFLHWTLAQLPTLSHSIYMAATTTIASRKHTYCSYSTHEWTRGIFASAGTIASQSSLTILMTKPITCQHEKINKMEICKLTTHCTNSHDRLSKQMSNHTSRKRQETTRCRQKLVMSRGN